MALYAVMLGARTCTVVADLSVLALTLLNTWSARGHGATLGVKTTFSQTLMRSGTLFSILCRYSCTESQWGIHRHGILSVCATAQCWDHRRETYPSPSVISVVNIIGLALGKNEEVCPFLICRASLLTLFYSLKLIEPMSTWTAACASSKSACIMKFSLDNAQPSSDSLRS